MLNKIPKSFIIFILLFLTFFFTLSGNIDSIDANTNIFLARKIVYENKIYFEKNENKLGMPVYYDKANERYYSVYNPGFALLQIPGQLIDRVIRHTLNAPIPNYPFEPNIILTLYSNILNTIIVPLIGVVIYKIVLLISRKKALSLKQVLLIVLLVLSTNLFVQGHHNFSHPLFTLLFLYSFYHLHKYLRDNSRSNLIYFSICFLLNALSYNATFVLLIPSIFIYSYLLRKKVLPIFIALLPAILSQLIWNYVRFGNPIKTGYIEIGFNIFDFNIFNVLMKLYGLTFAPSKGFFIYNPIILIVLVFLPYLFTKKTKALTIFFVTLLLSYLANYSISTIWHGEATYGPRYFTPVVPIGLVVFFLNLGYFKKQIHTVLIMLIIFIGITIQIPGILIPPFAFPYLSPSNCTNFNHSYFYNWSCSPVKVGWSHIIKRRTRETIIAITIDKKENVLTNKYPNPIRPFRTTYNDPLFNVISQYKTSNNAQIIGDIYSFIYDIWWIKGMLYKNIFNI